MNRPKIALNLPLLFHVLFSDTRKRSKVHGKGILHNFPAIELRFVIKSLEIVIFFQKMLYNRY